MKQIELYAFYDKDEIADKGDSKSGVSVTIMQS